MDRGDGERCYILIYTYTYIYMGLHINALRVIIPSKLKTHTSFRYVRTVFSNLNVTVHVLVNVKWNHERAVIIKVVFWV